MKHFRKPKKYDFNLIVIGGGSAGLVSAFIGSTVKSKVALIEKDEMGGDCLNTGCVPSKALISSAKMFYNTKKLETFGLQQANISFKFEDIMKRISSIIAKIAPNDSFERYESLGVSCFKAEAKIISPYEVQINEKILTTKSIVIAAGASPIIPKIEGIEKINFLTSNTIWDLKKLPQKMIILGGGAIGLEMAQSFNRLGSDVTLIEMQPKILPNEDEETTSFITNILLKEGVKVLTSHKAIKFETSQDRQFLYCETNKKETLKVEFTDIMIALGRKANTQNLTDTLNFELNKNGTIKTDSYLRTNYSNIYACGDIVGPYQFTHMASHQSWYATVNSLFGIFKKFKVDYSIVPWIIFTDPEIARVGLSENEAKKTWYSVRSTHL